jgi:hypothetical protein
LSIAQWYYETNYISGDVISDSWAQIFLSNKNQEFHTMLTKTINLTCPLCHKKNRPFKCLTQGAYKCDYCHRQFSNPSIATILQTQSTFQGGKIVGLSLLVSVGLFAFFVRSVLASNPLLPISSTSVTSRSETIPNPPSIIPINRSLPSKPVLVSQAMNGGGALTVSNGTNSDAYVKLAEPNSRTLVAAFYVKSNSSFTQEQIPDGTYKVLFVLGKGWNAQTQSFTKNKSFSKFDKLLNFTTTQMIGGIQYRVFKITLHPVPRGKAKTSGVSQKEFDSY